MTSSFQCAGTKKGLEEMSSRDGACGESSEWNDGDGGGGDASSVA